MLTERDLQRKSVQYRKALLRLIKASGAGHIRGDLSCLDILNVLYNRILRVSPETFKSPDRDYYIQSRMSTPSQETRRESFAITASMVLGSRTTARQLLANH